MHDQVDCISEENQVLKPTSNELQKNIDSEKGANEMLKLESEKSLSEFKNHSEKTAKELNCQIALAMRQNKELRDRVKHEEIDHEAKVSGTRTNHSKQKDIVSRIIVELKDTLKKETATHEE